MPTLPLYLPNAAADGSHLVMAPGGYEAWHLDAESGDGSVRVIAAVGEGYPFFADYLRRYRRYRRRPTRWRPPVAGGCPGAWAVVWENGRVTGAYANSLPPSEYAGAAVGRAEVQAGPDQVVREGDGSLSVRLGGNAFSAALRFRRVTSHGPFELADRAAASGGGEHFWLIADALCEVSGTISVAGRQIEFHGRGCHDHSYGTAPPGEASLRWMRGRAILADRLVAFDLAWRGSVNGPPVMRVVEADGAGVREVPVRSVRVEGAGGTPIAIRAELEARGEWRMETPNVIATAGAVGCVVYQSAGAVEGRVVCEVVG